MPELIPLFSSPIFIENIKKIDLDFSEVTWANNYNNSISQDQNILSNAKFRNLLDEITPCVFEYFHGVMGVNTETEIYITESWLNKTEKGEKHHRHWHPNSVVSGIVYLAGNENSGFTTFIKGQYESLEFEVQHSNLYNSKSWSIEPINNRILIFPSKLEHMVDEYQGDIPRITLSFNTFIRGYVNSLPLTRLQI